MKTYPILEEFAAPESMDDLPISGHEDKANEPKRIQASRRKKKATTSDDQPSLPL